MLSVQEVLLPVISQPFGVKMNKAKTLLLQIADNFVEMPIGGWTIIVAKAPPAKLKLLQRSRYL